MSFLQALVKTYEQNFERAGELDAKVLKDGTLKELMLLPLAHTTQTAHIEIVVDLEGSFYFAKPLEKALTVLPFTEASGSRSGSNYVPHVLHDKLMFVAGDYVKYVKTDIKKAEAYKKYVEQLKGWVQSPYTHPHIQAIYQYVQKGTVMEDLLDRGLLHLDEQGRLLPELEAIFVRFAVHTPEEVDIPPWRNKELFQRYIDYYHMQLSEQDMCYVKGELLPMTNRHPNKLRHSGDKAKLISANDASGFTFRGRFHTSEQAATISYDVSQKMHNALKWLIDKQGIYLDGRVFLVWGTDQMDVPPVVEDVANALDDWELYETEESVSSEALDILQEKLARQQRLLLQGLTQHIHIEPNEKIYILTIDAATPGRMAVLYYREFDSHEYFERLVQWHTTTSWKQIRKKGDEWHVFYGAPSFYKIAHAAYGPRPSEKVVKGVMERLTSCVLDGRKIPTDIVRSVINRASNPQFYKETWEWEQALTVACALVRKTYEKERFAVALDVTCIDRDYLFGRLLATADVLERRALGKEENRATSALRYMNAFQSKPLRTWNVIQSNLQPYQMKLGRQAMYYTKLIDEIAAQIPFEQFTDKPLSGKYLLGFYSQRQQLYTKKEEVTMNESN